MKLKPHKGVYKIPIHRHGKRYLKSKWVVYMSWFGTDEPADPIYENGSIYPTHPLVTDLTRADPKDTFIDLLSNLPDESIFEPIPKPSLWQRIKRKVKR